jgi:hypothetical protein
MLSLTYTHAPIHLSITVRDMIEHWDLDHLPDVHIIRPMREEYGSCHSADLLQDFIKLGNNTAVSTMTPYLLKTSSYVLTLVIWRYLCTVLYFTLCFDAYRIPTAIICSAATSKDISFTEQFFYAKDGYQKREKKIVDYR